MRVKKINVTTVAALVGGSISSWQEKKKNKTLLEEVTGGFIMLSQAPTNVHVPCVSAQ